MFAIDADRPMVLMVFDSTEAWLIVPKSAGAQGRASQLPHAMIAAL